MTRCPTHALRVTAPRTPTRCYQAAHHRKSTPLTPATQQALATPEACPITSTPTATPRSHRCPHQLPHSRPHPSPSAPHGPHATQGQHDQRTRKTSWDCKDHAVLNAQAPEAGRQQYECQPIPHGSKNPKPSPDNRSGPAQRRAFTTTPAPAHPVAFPDDSIPGQTPHDRLGHVPTTPAQEEQAQRQHRPNPRQHRQLNPTPEHTRKATQQSKPSTQVKPHAQEDQAQAGDRKSHHAYTLAAPHSHPPPRSPRSPQRSARQRTTRGPGRINRTGTRRSDGTHTTRAPRTAASEVRSEGRRPAPISPTLPTHSRSAPARPKRPFPAWSVDRTTPGESCYLPTYRQRLERPRTARQESHAYRETARKTEANSRITAQAQSRDQRPERQKEASLEATRTHQRLHRPTREAFHTPPTTAPLHPLQAPVPTSPHPTSSNLRRVERPQ